MGHHTQHSAAGVAAATLPASGKHRRGRGEERKRAVTDNVGRDRITLSNVGRVAVWPIS